MSEHRSHDVKLDPCEPTSLSMMRLAGGAFVIGLIAIGITAGVSLASEDTARRFFFAYLVNYAFLLSITLGGLFFVMINHVTRAGATVVTRRIGELVAALMPVLIVLFVPIVVGLLHYNLYRWTDPEHWYHGEHLEVVLGKAAFLNIPFFLIRWLVYFAIWSAFGSWYLATSRRQDHTGDAQLSLRMQKVSTWGLVVFAVTVTLASFDLLMTLQPEWFSTIFGVYFFAGAVVSFYAVLTLLLNYSQWRGALGGCVRAGHFQDTGKMMYAFVIFWTYIAYSQYMLIWYGNIPEETGWFSLHGASTEGAFTTWSAAVLVLLGGHFIVPFLGLMSKHIKRRRALMCFWAVWLLVMHWVDLWWIVMPSFNDRPDGLMIGLPEIGCLVGLGLIYLAAYAVVASNKPLLPVHDPRLHESLVFENV